MKYFIEETFNDCIYVEAMCTGSCNRVMKKEKRTELIHSSISKFIIVVLSRGQSNPDGYMFNKNKVKVTDNVCIK